MIVPFATSTFLQVFFLLFIFIPLVFLWVSAIFDIFRRTDLSGWGIAGWLFLIFVIPFFGTLLYFIFRRPTGEERVALAQAQSEYDTARHRDSASRAADALEKLAKLHENGSITDAEFAKQKEKLLN